jgi:hypothetical protein
MPTDLLMVLASKQRAKAAAAAEATFSRALMLGSLFLCLVQIALVLENSAYAAAVLCAARQ